METKKCPYCGGEIMATAKKCKHCGEWIEKANPTVVPQENASNETETNTDVEITHSSGKKIVWCVVGALVLVFVIWMIAAANQKSDWEKAMEEYNSQSSYGEQYNPQPSYNEAVVEADETVSYYGDEGVCPYDGIPDDEYEEYYGTSPYESNSSANAWE